eukprot:CAMPEP_0197743514 /NCGR_PEP_ID=MMETSP1435-20131217/35437_1 /TAXON_ID=426625 /ORGANISM="Chaetoceros brevis, Strain CCMP164" /LENGTH=112 /DNA_ID=CAMNT_0043334485 /DNA_START=58 /DNA_END=396 /DNA_ORIENTATION=-
MPSREIVNHFIIVMVTPAEVGEIGEADGLEDTLNGKYGLEDPLEEGEDEFLSLSPVLRVHPKNSCMTSMENNFTYPASLTWIVSSYHCISDTGLDSAVTNSDEMSTYCTFSA